MSPELRLHGKINDSVEYFATAAGCNAAHQHFFELSENSLRLFAPGSELSLTSSGLTQTGTGGSFCEYMFGIDLPVADLARNDVHNRLTLLEAGNNSERHREIKDRANLVQGYEDIFRQGHAVDNFFFFIDGLQRKSDLEHQQQVIRDLGKTLKHLHELNQKEDFQLAETLRSTLPGHCAVFLIRLSNSKAKHFQTEFQKTYYRDKQMNARHQAIMDELAENLGLDNYQKERICIDVMYHHRDNYPIIDEYRKVLIESYQKGEIDRQDYARLTRLKALALRNEIPLDLLTVLDNKLQPRIDRITKEPEYLAITRDILQDLKLERELTKRDMIQLLYAKRKARHHHDNAFEQLLLETGKLFDEQIKVGRPLPILKEFSRIITLFDLYDTTSTNISRLAFMENFQTSVEWLENLLQSRAKFNNLEKGLFRELFFTPLAGNPYLGRFGRYKLARLEIGLEEVAADVLPIQHLNADLKMIEHKEELFQILYYGTKDRIRNRYYRYDSKQELEVIYQELNQELLDRGTVKTQVDATLFQEVVYDIKKEIFYLRNLLPDIISTGDHELRNDFLANSGLDIFHIEELEKEYVSLNGLDQECLQQLRSGQ